MSHTPSMTSGNPAQGRRQIHIGVTTLAWLNLYQNLKQIIQDAIAPEIQSIKGDLKSLETQIIGLHGQIGGLHGQIGGLKGEIVELRAEFHSFEARVEDRFAQQSRQWELAMEVRERLASLEAQLRHRG